MPSDMVWMDGRVLPASEARVSVFDLGFLRGIGVFETLRTYGGRPHALQPHLDRLWKSAAAIGIARLHSEAAVRAQIAAIQAQMSDCELRINLIVTPGFNTDGLFGAETPTYVLLARVLVAPDERVYREGKTAITFVGSRVLPEHKTTTYITGQAGMMACARAGAYEAIYVDADDRVYEGVTSNLLAVIGGVIVQPDTPTLPGITQAELRAVAEKIGLRWEIRALSRQELYAANEVWICSAVRELMPLVRIDEHPIGSGKPGPLHAKLHAAYRTHCLRGEHR